MYKTTAADNNVYVATLSHEIKKKNWREKKTSVI